MPPYSTVTEPSILISSVTSTEPIPAIGYEPRVRSSVKSDTAPPKGTLHLVYALPFTATYVSILLIELALTLYSTYRLESVTFTSTPLIFLIKTIFFNFLVPEELAMILASAASLVSVPSSKTQMASMSSAGMKLERSPSMPPSESILSITVLISASAVVILSTEPSFSTASAV